MSSPHQLSRSCYNATRNSFTNETRNGSSQSQAGDGKLRASRALRSSRSLLKYLLHRIRNATALYLYHASRSSSASQWDFNLYNFRIKFFSLHLQLELFFSFSSPFAIFKFFLPLFPHATSSPWHPASVVHDIKYPWHHKTFIMVFLYSYKIQIVSLW